MNRCVALALCWLLVSHSVAAGIHEITLKRDNAVRTALVYAPENLPDAAALVIVMHGYGSSAERIMAYTGFNELARQHGYIVAYPQGTLDKQENAFFQVGYEFHAESQVNDVAFIRDLVAHLVARYPIDVRQVFASGMSNGGDMSYLLGCKAADMFRAVAPVAGTMMVSTDQNCRPSQALSVLAISGTADNITLYSGDLANVDGWGAYLGVEEVIDGWAAREGLERARHERKRYRYNDPIDIVTYASANSAQQVVLYRVQGGGHDWPGARFSWWDLRRVVSRITMGFGKHSEFDATAEIVDFFNGFRQP